MDNARSLSRSPMRIRTAPPGISAVDVAPLDLKRTGAA
jgi:hypothetical protein